MRSLRPVSSATSCRVTASRLLHDPFRLAVGAGGLAHSGAGPIVSVAGVEGREELCQRAIPAIFGSVGRCGGDHLPRLLILATNQRYGRMRSSFGEEFVGPVLIRTGAPFTHMGSPCPFL